MQPSTKSEPNAAIIPAPTATPVSKPANVRTITVRRKPQLAAAQNDKKLLPMVTAGVTEPATGVSAPKDVTAEDTVSKQQSVLGSPVATNPVSQKGKFMFDV